MNAVIYTRCATPNRQSHEDQRKACERLADELGYKVVQEFHDKGRSRPGLDQLLAAIRDHKASAVIVADLYRIARTIGAFAQVMETLDSAAVPLYVVGQGQLDLTAPPVLGLMTAIAEYEAEHTEGDITR